MKDQLDVRLATPEFAKCVDDEPVPRDCRRNSNSQRTGLAEGNAVDFPVTQQHIADTLGMSLVHTNKTLQILRRSRAVRWDRNELEIRDAAELGRIAQYDAIERAVRPFI